MTSKIGLARPQVFRAVIPTRHARETTLAIATTLVLAASTASAQQPTGVPPGARGGAQWAAVQQTLGGRGKVQPGGVLKFGFPRSDLQVTVDGVVLKPALALGSWVAFKRAGQSGRGPAIVTGDLVLTEREVGPVMRLLQQGGVEQTALHNHVLGESPRVMYMHVMAHGDPDKVAAVIRSALEATGTPLAEAPATAGDSAREQAAGPGPIDLDTAGIARALGVSGAVNGGVYQLSVPRAERVTDHGTEVPPAMGVATAINFQPTGGGKAATTGDFVMTAREVNPVIRELGEHGIQVTALHSHMLTETPRLFFMHFWANDDAVPLARGLRSALDHMRVRRVAAK